MKLDIGCGRKKREGYIGIDTDKNSDADIIASALYLPVRDSVVDEIRCSHLLEHLYPEEAQKFFDEVYRVIKEDGKANVKIDRDWTEKKLLRKDSTHRYRYSVGEIEKMLGKFQSKKVERKSYLFGFKSRHKIFVELRK